MRTCVRDGRKALPARSSGERFERKNVVMAETIAREHEKLPLDFALALVHLYAEKHDPRFERAALRYPERCIAEKVPTLEDVAGIANLLAERKPR